jgi:hypothetical protein
VGTRREARKLCAALRLISSETQRTANHDEWQRYVVEQLGYVDTRRWLAYRRSERREEESQ